MDKYIVSCPAKINLFLNITGKKDFMHTLNVINQSITLYDYLEVEILKDNIIQLECNDKDIPLNSDNSIYKSLSLMKELFNIKDGFKINIVKQIPVQSGLGGESTNAAGIILFINQIYKLKLSQKELYEIGKKIGNDVPFCIHGGLAKIDEDGYIQEYNKIPYFYYLIVKPQFGLSTQDMYNQYDNLVYDFEKKKIELGYNDFEKIVSNEIIDIKNELINNKAIFSNLTGSGSAVIGAFKTYDEQIKVYEYFKGKREEVYMATPCEGVKIKKKVII